MSPYWWVRLKTLLVHLSLPEMTEQNTELRIHQDRLTLFLFGAGFFSVFAYAAYISFAKSWWFLILAVISIPFFFFAFKFFDVVMNPGSFYFKDDGIHDYRERFGPILWSDVKGLRTGKLFGNVFLIVDFLNPEVAEKYKGGRSDGLRMSFGGDLIVNFFGFDYDEKKVPQFIQSQLDKVHSKNASVEFMSNDLKQEKKTEEAAAPINQATKLLSELGVKTKK